MNYPYYSQQNPYLTQYTAPQVSQPRYVEQPQIGIKGRPVSSIKEVKATSIDFDGSVFVFPDLANKKIYTKQINLDGTSTLNIYELKPYVEPQVQNAIEVDKFVTREEFEKAITQIQEKLAPTQEPAQATKEPVNLNF